MIRQQTNPNKLPPCSSIAGASGTFTSKLGVQASAGAQGNLLGLRLGIDVGVDLMSYNTPLNGSTYISHELDATITIGPLRVGG